ncbi:MAG: DNA-deoxyinosine glycosylase [Clostridiales bacterium]|nr:DNA-deoxyinosine glycosylase [Clostridiales bacterium]
MLIHPIPPVFDKDSRVLILGSFPSVRSREEGFFYGHPQNRFWKVAAKVFGENTPLTVEDKKDFLIRNHIALWDVIGSCEIDGSADSSIRNVTVNDLSVILETADIQEIFLNGRKAYQLYQKYMYPDTLREGICLPSTSPANAAWSIEKLTDSWIKIRIR